MKDLTRHNKETQYVILPVIPVDSDGLPIALKEGNFENEQRPRVETGVMNVIYESIHGQRNMTPEEFLNSLD